MNTMLRRLCLLALLCLGCWIQALGATEITIDQDAHSLTAPEGVAYQWFYNNEPISGERSRHLVITEPGNYSVEIIDEQGAASRQEATVIINALGAIIKIYIIGDSTVCNYSGSAYPEAGWGQMLPYFFNSANVQIDNRAIGGRSSRSFYQEGRWTPIKDALKAGDYVFIQFGHNDRDTKPERYTSPTDFKGFLTTYINDTRAKGGIPVLVSPMVMNAWRNGVMRNVFTEAGNDYRGAMLEVATSLNVAFVDLNMKSWNLYKSLGQEYITRFIFHTYVAGEYPNYPNGISDGTHFQEMGAIENARLVVDGLKELTSNTSVQALTQYLNPTYQVKVNVNPTTAPQLTTRTANYPANINVTLKTIPKNTSTFYNWNNAVNTSVATTLIYQFKMPAAATSYTAMYTKTTCTPTLWYADADGDGKGDPAVSQSSCTQPTDYVADNTDKCPTDAAKTVAGYCGCGKTETSCLDCNNIPNGTAMLDNCDRCVAGTTGKTACTNLAEAEVNACSYEGVTETSNAGFKGDSYINVPNAIGASIAFRVDALNAGNATLSFRYANGSANDRPAQVTLNNLLQANALSFPSTGAFTTWKAIDLTLSLAKGNNIVKLSATLAEGLANIDQIGFVSTGLGTGECVVTGVEGQDLAHAWRISPNPFINVINLTAPRTFTYSLFDVSGKLTELGTAQGTVEAGHNLPQGIYLLKMETEGKSRMTKVIKQ